MRGKSRTCRRIAFLSSGSSTRSETGNVPPPASRRLAAHQHGRAIAPVAYAPEMYRSMKVRHFSSAHSEPIKISIPGFPSWRSSNSEDPNLGSDPSALTRRERLAQRNELRAVGAVTEPAQTIVDRHTQVEGLAGNR